LNRNSQLKGDPVMPKITPNLWFDTEVVEAAEFYVSVFPNSKITDVTHYTEAGPRPAGTVLTFQRRSRPGRPGHAGGAGHDEAGPGRHRGRRRRGLNADLGSETT
jgi:hypothetical protein